MLKKFVTTVSVCGAALAGAAAYVSWKDKKVSQNVAESSLTGLREWNSSLQREIVRSHRDARDVCIAVLTVNGVTRKSNPRLFEEIESKFADTVRGSDLLGRNDENEFFVLFPEAGLDEGYEAVERLQEVLPPTTSLAAGIAVWDHCETAAELVSRAASSMAGEEKATRAKIGVSETPQPVDH